MKKIALLVGCCFLANLSIAQASTTEIAPKLCAKYTSLKCITVAKKATWASLFPDETQRQWVMRLNHMNTPLHAGKVIAVPIDLAQSKLDDYNPFAQQIAATGQNQILVSPVSQSWAAYDATGNLVKWGPASLGSEYCPDVHRRCHTHVGESAVYTMGGASCKSHKFPLKTHGGAPTPYCMYFYKGFAIHGAPNEMLGYNASHGCVRVLTEDAQWLNQNFVKLGTKVTVLPY